MKRRLLIIAVFLLLGAVKESHLLRIIVSLLLGVVTTFGVAWLCAATAECDKQASFFIADRPGSSSVPFFVLVHRRSGFGLDHVAYPPTDALEWRRLGLKVQDVRPDLPRWARWPNEPSDTETLYVAAGWPLKAVVCHSMHEYFPRGSGRRPKPPVWKDAYVIEGQAAGSRTIATSGVWQRGVPPMIEIGQGIPLAGYRRSTLLNPPPNTGLPPNTRLVWWTPIPARVFPLRPLPLGFAINTLFYAALLWPLICVPLALRRFLRLRRGLCPKCAYPMGESAVCTECGKPLPSTVRIA